MDRLNDIAVFVRVVESGSFTAASERLSLSKSVVSKYVTRLENHLGARLLNRTTRRLSLTEVGRTLYERCQLGLEQIEEAQAEVSRLQGEPRGTLRINAPMSFGVLHLAPAMPEFIDRYPEVAVDMSLDDRKLDPVEAGFDVSVRISELPDSSLIARRIAPCRHVIAASPGYLARNGTPRTPDELTHHKVIVYRYQDSADVWHLKAPGRAPVSVSVSGALRMNSSLAIREALLNGAGITRIPTFVVGQDLRQGTLKAVLSEYGTLELSIHMVLAHRRHLAPKVRAFVDFLGERFSDEPYWDV